jgi:hypothetical protein
LVRLHKITTYFDSFFFYLSLRGFLEKKIDKRIKVMKKIYDETEEGRRGKNRLMAAATPSSCVCLYMYSRKIRKEAKERKKKNFFSKKEKT